MFLNISNMSSTIKKLRPTNGFGQVWLDNQNFSSYAQFSFGSGLDKLI